MKASPFIFGMLLCLIGCPSANNSGTSVDAILSADNGTYGGDVTSTFITGVNPTAAAIRATQDGYILLDIASGAASLFRFGSGPFGQFTAWQVQNGASFTSEIDVDGATANVTRTITNPGASVIEFSIHMERTDGSEKSSGDGTGRLIITLSAANLVFDLTETVTFSSGPLTGQIQQNTISGQLAKIDDVPAPQSPGQGSSTDESQPTPQSPPPAGQIANYSASGSETLPDGSSANFTEIRQVETTENPQGQPFNAVSETHVHTVTAADGTTSQVTTTSKSYYKFNEDGKGRILGFQEGGQDYFIVDPADGVPGAVDMLAVGQMRNYTAKFDDGTVDVFSETITGTSQVVLPSGAFDVFLSVAHLERTHTNGTVETVDLTSSIHPTLGLIFRHVEGSVRNPDGSVKTTKFDEYLGTN